MQTDDATAAVWAGVTLRGGHLATEAAIAIDVAAGAIGCPAATGYWRTAVLWFWLWLRL